MTSERFEQILKRRMDLMRYTLSAKATEYANGTDRLANFKRAGAMMSCSPAQALYGMLAKHLVSVMDMIDGFTDLKLPTKARIDEKIGDTINYMVLLEAIFMEHHDRLDKKASGDISDFNQQINEALNNAKRGVEIKLREQGLISSVGSDKIEEIKA